MRWNRTAGNQTAGSAIEEARQSFAETFPCKAFGKAARAFRVGRVIEGVQHGGGEGDGGQAVGGGFHGDHAEAFVVAGAILHRKHERVGGEIGGGNLRIVLRALAEKQHALGKSERVQDVFDAGAFSVVVQQRARRFVADHEQTHIRPAFDDGGAVRETGMSCKQPDDPLKVLFIDHSAEIGGGQLVLEELLSNISLPSKVVFLSPGPLIERLPLTIEAVQLTPGGDLFTLGKETTIYARLWSARRLPTLLKRLTDEASEADLIYANLKKALLLAALTARSIQKPLYLASA